MGGLLCCGRGKRSRPIWDFHAHRQMNAVFTRQCISAASQLDQKHTGRETRLRFACGNAANGGLIDAHLLGKVALAEALAE